MYTEIEVQGNGAQRGEEMNQFTRPTPSKKLMQPLARSSMYYLMNMYHPCMANTEKGSEER